MLVILSFLYLTFIFLASRVENSSNPSSIGSSNRFNTLFEVCPSKKYPLAEGLERTRFQCSGCQRGSVVLSHSSDSCVKLYKISIPIRDQCVRIVDLEKGGGISDFSLIRSCIVTQMYRVTYIFPDEQHRV